MSHRSNLTFKVAKKISILGNEQHLTVNTLSAKSKVSSSTIRRIMNARIKQYNPSIRTMDKLAKAMHTTIDQLLNFSKPNKVSTTV